MKEENDKTPIDMFIEKINSFESAAIRKSTVIEIAREIKAIESQYCKNIYLQGQLSQHITQKDPTD